MKPFLFAAVALSPALLMLLGSGLALFKHESVELLWRRFITLCGLALLMTGVIAVLMAVSFAGSGQNAIALHPWFDLNPLGTGLALLVQLLGTVIAAFSKRYLEGEPGQHRYMTALGAVLAAVQLLVLADHWLVLLAAWALVGLALQNLLCFYPDRPFAQLAAHKKRIADRVADVLLIAAAALAWSEVGSGSFTALWSHVQSQGMSVALQACAVFVVLAVILRTALMPVHGWLIQVMEAPTPVSALLHAGVVNLGGYVLIRFAPLLDQALPARSLLVCFGLATAVLAGMVMLTRITIKVRLAWSTVAQMGFMLLECGLGLYTLAALHLIGHSLYKAHAFLSASTVVRQTRLQALCGKVTASPLSVLLAPLVAIPMVALMQSVLSDAAWPWWWSGVFGLAWSPLLWLPVAHTQLRQTVIQAAFGLLAAVGLTGAALLAHALPLGLHDVPNQTLGLLALIGMAALYLCLALLQQRPQSLRAWRRWSYAGFYVDEIYTRLALQFWPTSWNPRTGKAGGLKAPPLRVARAPEST